jgi:hypothetical protein
MKMIKCYLSIFLLAALVIIQPAHAITEAKEKDIQTLLKIMGVSSIMADMLVTTVINQEKKRYPDLPKNVEYALSKAIHDVVIDHAPELNKMAAPLYDKYYTHNEIKQLIKFFSSPIGRKYLTVAGPMMQDMIPIAQAWGEKIGPIVAKRAEQELKKYGYK